MRPRIPSRYLRLLKNTAALAIVKGSQFLVPVITLPLLLRTVGLEGYGVLNFALSVAQFLAVFVQYGFAISATRRISAAREDPHQINRIYSVTFATAGLMAGGGFLVYTLLLLQFQVFQQHFLIFLVCGAYLGIQALIPVWLFQGLERMGYIAWVHAGSRLLFIAGLFVLVRTREDLLWVPLLNLLAALMALLTSLVLVSRSLNVHWQTFQGREVLSTLQQGRDVFISQLAPNLYKNFSVFMVGYVSPAAIVGAYSAALKLIEVAISIGTVVSNAVLPILARNPSHHRAYSHGMLVLSLFISVCLFVGSHWIVNLLMEAPAAELVYGIQVLSITVLFVFTYHTFGVNYLMLRGQEHRVRNYNLAVSLGGFALLLVSVPALGYQAALWIVFANRLCIALLSYFMYRRHRRLPD